jgi:hypothetical protein
MEDVQCNIFVVMDYWYYFKSVPANGRATHFLDVRVAFNLRHSKSINQFCHVHHPDSHEIARVLVDSNSLRRLRASVASSMC